MREPVQIVASLVVLREMAACQMRVGVVLSVNRVLVIDCDHVVRWCEMRDRLRDFSTTHILGLIFLHKLIIAISNGTLNCISHHKLMPGQPKPLRNFSWYTESDWRQSHRHIVRCHPCVRCIGTTALRCGRWSLFVRKLIIAPCFS